MQFLEASRKARDEQREANKQRRRNKIRRARWIAAASVLAFIVTAILAGWAWFERDHAVKAEEEAKQHAKIAEKWEIRAKAAEQARTESLFDSSVTHASLLAQVEDYAEAREVLRKTVELDPDIPETRRHARNLLAGEVAILGGSADKVYEGAGAALSGGVAVSPDGRWLAAAGERATLVLFDAETRDRVDSYLAPHLKGPHGCGLRRRLLP